MKFILKNGFNILFAFEGLDVRDQKFTTLKTCTKF